jgi:hypothetical protein
MGAIKNKSNDEKEARYFLKSPKSCLKKQISSTEKPNIYSLFDNQLNDSKEQKKRKSN